MGFNSEFKGLKELCTWNSPLYIIYYFSLCTLPILCRSTCRISRAKVVFRYSPVEAIIIVKIITRYRVFFEGGLPNKIIPQLFTQRKINALTNHTHVWIVLNFKFSECKYI